MRIKLDAAIKPLKVLFFYALWCQPCMKILPEILAISKDFGQKVDLIWVNLNIF
jgi:thiol-disulfide isomerase/thioredoxin